MTPSQRCILITCTCLAHINILHAAVITFSPGIAYENSGQTQALLLQTSPQKLSNTYITNKHWKHSFSAQLFLGRRAYTKEKFNLDFGATLGFVNDIKLNGVVNQFGLSNFDNLSYQYQTNSLSAMGTAKLLYSLNDWLQPYLLGSLGFSNNTAANYQETPRITGAVPMLAFGDRTTNTFAYSAGAGLMYDTNQHVSIGLGYQFSDLGKARLGVSAAQQTTQTLNLKHIYVNQLLFNFNWRV